MPRVRHVVPLVLAVLLLAASAAHGSGSGLVVSQVYGGGGNAGASYANDFVELLNSGSAAVDLSGWSVQYAAASSTSWQATALSGSIQPGRYYLVQLASSGAVGTALPAADATGTTNIAASGGKVALVHDTAPLSCGAAAGSCSSTAAVDDLVGYGSATDYEGSGAAPAISATTAAVRAGAGCTDSGSNAADFAAAAPAPRNGSSPAAACGTSGITRSAGVDIDIQPVLSISLERSSLSFGGAAAGDTPAAISEHVTVVSNNATGYALTVHRTGFAPNDLPLGVASSAPAGAQLGASLAGGHLAAIPTAPAGDLLLGTTNDRSGSGGDVWPASIAFTAPLPAVAPGRYSATVTFTVIGR